MGLFLCLTTVLSCTKAPFSTSSQTPHKSSPVRVLPRGVSFNRENKFRHRLTNRDFSSLLRAVSISSRVALCSPAICISRHMHDSIGYSVTIQTISRGRPRRIPKSVSKHVGKNAQAAYCGFISTTQFTTRW